MGRGIAYVAATKGLRVNVSDPSKEAIQTAKASMQGYLQKGVARAKMTESQAKATQENITYYTNLTQAAQMADLVIEAVPEKLDLKISVLAAVESANSTAWLATNTSSLSIGKISQGLARPSALIGMHFFNPVYAMQLVEVVTHNSVAEELIGVAKDFAQAIGKTPIVVADSPGFASSRLGLVIGLEAIRMLEEGVASASDIDTAMRLGYGHPMGPLELTDLVGLDVRLKIATYLADTVGKHFSPPTLLQKKVANGELGKKVGKGFYVWEDGKRLESTD